MRVKKVLRYYCDYCGKGHFKKQACTDHEVRCFKNPDTSSCRTCLHNIDAPYWTCDIDSKGLLSKAEFYKLDKEEVQFSKVLKTQCPLWSKGPTK